MMHRKQTLKYFTIVLVCHTNENISEAPRSLRAPCFHAPHSAGAAKLLLRGMTRTVSPTGALLSVPVTLQTFVEDGLPPASTNFKLL